MPVTRRQFAHLLDTAMRDRGMTNPELARLVGANKDTVSRWRNEADTHGVPSAEKRRAMERALRKPVGYLDGERVAMVREPVIPPPEGRGGAHQAPALADVQGKSPAEVRALIEDLLEVYDRRGSIITSRQVVVWLTMIEEACRSTASGGPDAAGPPGSAGAGPDAPPPAPGRHHSGGRR